MYLQRPTLSLSYKYHIVYCELAWHIESKQARSFVKMKVFSKGFKRYKYISLSLTTIKFGVVHTPKPVPF